MISFFARLIIFLVFVGFVFGFSAGLNLNAFIVACVCMCAWITIVSFKDIFWWLFAFSVLFSLIFYDYLGIYILILIGVSYLFDILYMYIRRSGYDTKFILYLAAFSIAFVTSSLMELIEFHTVFNNFNYLPINIIFTAVLFFFLLYFIRHIEKFINLYTHGTDMRCHT